MKRYCILFIFLFLSVNELLASHISGGEMSYEYLGPGSSTSGRFKYRVTLKLYRDCNAPAGSAQLDDFVTFTLYKAVSFDLVRNIKGIAGSEIKMIYKIPDDPCISDDIETAVCFQTRTYTTIIDDVPANLMGYVVAYQRCCRVGGMVNIASENVGSTYYAEIPGFYFPGAETNTSPVFVSNDVVLVCSARRIDFDFHATDIDGDELEYKFYNAFKGGAPDNTAPDPANKPPYVPVTYNGGGGYSADFPLGPLVKIDPKTGLISGIAPNLGAGANAIFSITVLVSEYRIINDARRKIGDHFKDLQIRIVDCRTTTAFLAPRPTICDTLEVAFQNDASNNPEPAYLWDFGDPASGINNTSTLPTPSHTFSAAGVYSVKLVLNKGIACGDSTSTEFKVFPGFYPGFTVDGKCLTAPVFFKDTSKTAYGVIDSWLWNFNDAPSTSNESTLQNPSHTFLAAGNHNVVFTVTSDKGCRATVPKAVLISAKANFTVPNDTLICNIDTLQLNATGTGVFLWSPNYNINNINIKNPLVSPDVTTVYYLNFLDTSGCIGNDSVKVRVVDHVTQFAPNDTTICQTDGIVLKLVSDALYYQWTESPAGNTLNNAQIRNPIATPVTNTTYSVTGSIGKCFAENNINIKVVPYPAANAGPDQTICVDKSAQLSASGGSSYSWSPSAFLNNRLIPDPISIKPTANIKYVVTVTDTLGCPKPVKDTMIVFVARIVADAGPRDTAVVMDQPLLLQATGSTNYLWSPSQWLSNTNISNPVALPKTDIEYIVKVSNDVGCFDYDSIRVHLYKLDAGMYLPTGFSPNGDGLNDYFHPIIIGMKSLDLFRVYNRFGQLLYSGTDAVKGWDGTFGGRGQEPATYVWYAEGTDYKNNKLKKKGYVVLIR